ncbi:MAG: NUDIX hydrolase [Brevinema sp.]
MIRAFEEKDIPFFPNIKILSPADSPKNYLLIERKPFVSCLIIIDQKYTILVRQFRPVIQQNTVEMPMGKIEEYDHSTLHAIIRELSEEISLFITADKTDKDRAYLSIINSLTKDSKNIIFSSFKFTEEKVNYISPGFSNSKQYPFILELSTHSGDFLKECIGYELYSQENNLIVTVSEISKELMNHLDGLTRFTLISYLFNQQQPLIC